MDEPGAARELIWSAGWVGTAFSLSKSLRTKVDGKKVRTVTITVTVTTVDRGTTTFRLKLKV